MRHFTHKFGVAPASILLNEWHEKFSGGTATSVLKLWQEQPFAAYFKSLIEEDTGVHRALFEKFVCEIQPFDCLSIAGWQPTENELSDVIAALFSQSWGHTFGPEVLKHLLSFLISKEVLCEMACESAKRSVSSLDKDTQIFVRREHWSSSSRADIDIYTTGPNGCFLRVEHKIRDNRETFIGGKHQTDRLWVDAVTRAASLGLNQENVIGIFLTPGGDPAMSRNFISLSFVEFANVVTNAVSGMTGRTTGLSNAVSSVLGFMSFYGRAW
jgi:hypothetical protein